MNMTRSAAMVAAVAAVFSLGSVRTYVAAETAQPKQKVIKATVVD